MDILEDLIIQYIFAVFSLEQQRELTTMRDVEENLHEDAIEEMKDELYNRVYNLINWRRILQTIEENCAEESCGEEDNGSECSEDSASGRSERSSD